MSELKARVWSGYNINSLVCTAMAEPKTKFWSRLNIYLGLYHNGRTKDKNFMKWNGFLICTAMAEPKAGVLGEEEEESSLTCTAMAKSGAMREPWISPSNLSKQVVCVLLLFLYMVCVCKFSSGRNDQRPTLEQSGILVFIGLGVQQWPLEAAARAKESTCTSLWCRTWERERGWMVERG